MPQTAPPKPKASSIWAELRTQILHGSLKPGDSLPTQQELGTRYGVAEGTVSVAMARLVQEGLITRKRGAGSFVTEQRAVRSRVVDVVRAIPRRPESVPSVPQQHFEPPWLGQLDHHLDDVARQNNWVLRWHHLREDEAAEPDIIEQRFTDAKAVVALVRTAINRPFLTRLDHAGIPMAAIWISRAESGNLPERAAYPQLTPDRQQSAELATEHLVALGYQRIGFAGTTATPWVTGFLNTVTRHRLPMNAAWFVRVDHADDQTIRQSLRELLQGPDRPRALVCETDRFAVDAEAIARELGLSIPEDLALIACMEGSHWQQAKTPLTTIFAPEGEIFRLAVEMAQNTAPTRSHDHRPLLDPVAVPGTLTVRESCGGKIVHGVSDPSSAVARGGERRPDYSSR